MCNFGNKPKKSKEGGAVAHARTHTRAYGGTASELQSDTNRWDPVGSIGSARALSLAGAQG